MADEFRKMLGNNPVLPIETQGIRPLSSRFSFAPEVISDKLSSNRPFVNDCLNSRLSHRLPIGDLVIRESAILGPGSRPKHILHGSGRIIVQGDGPWLLFDQECQLLAKGYVDSGSVFLDEENELFFFFNAVGLLEAHNIANGNRLFSASLIFGYDYTRSFITRQGERMIIVSTERVIDRDAKEKPKNSTIEVLEFNEPQIIDQGGILKSSKIVADLIRKTILLRSARYDETLVVVTNNQICLLDFDLKVKTALNGDFKPFVMSLDNAGMIYLVLYDSGVPKLRAINPNGERIFSVQLPEEMLNVFYPPIITYDHRVFLIKDNYLMAFAANGHPLWEYKSHNLVAGAVVTADNQLLISDGSELGVIDANGLYRTLYNFKDETLQTPPTITGNGDLVVATDKKLYCLAVRQHENRQP